MLSADIPAIYLENRADDVSWGVQEIEVDLDEVWPGTSVYFEPLGARAEALLTALLEGSGPALREAIREAAMFLELLPVTVPDPVVAIEDDGQVGLDWRVGDKALSLNLGKQGMIGYSALFGTESAYGRTPFSGTELPPRVAPLLSSLAEQR